MLRVWGGANVENPEFYDACDEKGILVWQDFFYASGQFPNDDFFLKEAEIETINVVKHLRNRACLAAWCAVQSGCARRCLVLEVLTPI